jgi:hypothetical protein
MLGIFLILLGLIALVVLFSRFAMSFGARQFGRLVGEQHMVAEYILETGKAPPPWVRRAPRPGGDSNRVRRRLLHGLDGLVRHFGIAQVFENESARALFLERLGTVRAAWVTADLGEIISPRGTPWPPPHDVDGTAPAD